MIKHFIVVGVLIFSTAASAKVFKNSFIEFELSDSWGCVLAAAEWICNPTSHTESREAALVISAKVTGPEENFEAFKKGLKEPRTIQARVGTPIQSKVLQFREVLLQNQKWIEAYHFNSEIEDFYSHYLATVKQNLAVMISFNAHKAHFNKYESIYSKMISTLKLIASKQMLESPLPVLKIEQTATQAPPAVAAVEIPKTQKRPWLFYLLVVLSVTMVILFIYTLVDSGKKPRRKRR